MLIVKKTLPRQFPQAKCHSTLIYDLLFCCFSAMGTRWLSGLILSPVVSLQWHWWPPVTSALPSGTRVTLDNTTLIFWSLRDLKASKRLQKKITVFSLKKNLDRWPDYSSENAAFFWNLFLYWLNHYFHFDFYAGFCTFPLVRNDVNSLDPPAELWPSWGSSRQRSHLPSSIISTAASFTALFTW